MLSKPVSARFSLTVIGIPAMGPASPDLRAASAATASARAASNRRIGMALTLGSMASMRAMQASTSSTEETAPASSWRRIWLALSVCRVMQPD